MKTISILVRICSGTLPIILSLVTARGAQPDWNVKLEAAEACSCAPACPCIFGSAPTRGHCHVNFWMHVKEGHYGSVRLDGLSLLMSDEMRKSRRYYFDTSATAEQVAAITNVFAQMPALAVEKVVSVEQVPMHFEKTDSSIKFSAPASQVEMTPKKGKQGKPITIQNTGLEDYIQYISVTNSHRSPTLDFAYSGTSAATWKLEGQSK
ncbi:MAG TPA: DUF1326 domain-containing protein [Candidatus Limnocylindrales bacterium]|nr:DUF1326 domain-containing protein [Candidatus Limnocylindrales bacterium]